MLIKNTEFKCSSISNIYEINKTVKTAKTESSFSTAISKADTQSAKNVDKIEISSADESHASIKEIKDKISSDLSRDTDPLKLENIKNSLKNGSYNFDSSEIAGLLLSDY